MNKFQDMTGALICGGKSKRFGSDKRLFQHKGKTLLEISFQNLNQICFETVCVFRDSPPSPLTPYPHIFDDLEVEGPLAGVLSALKYSKTPFVFVLPCDVPNLPVEYLKSLALLKDPNKIVVPYTTRLEPLIGIYPKSFYDTLKIFSFEKRASLKAFLYSLPVSKKLFVSLFDMGDKKVNMSYFENFNRPRAYVNE
ncbi:MAG: molybdenum cofactor guanylyltransferase [Deltaproteobacteria bacterium]|nr:molybdenum cofactor guanylyltransferase [Deltaproteobacteria bacterium]